MPDRVLVIDLNADLGEEVTDDRALLGLVTSANLACGYHAGGPEIMRAVCAAAAAGGVVVGAQVSYDDREHFGRVARDVAPGVLTEQIADQVGTLAEIAATEGTRVAYLKPHGALYHRVLDDSAQAAAVLAGSGSLPVLTMPGVLADLAARDGRRVFREGFPDRGYGRDGRLLPRDDPRAHVSGVEAVAAQALSLADAGEVHSLCLHGDSPGAVDHLRAVRRALLDAGLTLRAFA